MGRSGTGSRGSGRAVVVVAPRFTSLARFGADTIEAKLQVMTRHGVSASLMNLDAIVNSPLAEPPLSRGLQNAGPMAAYYLESFLKRRGYRATAVVDWEDRGSIERAMRGDPVAVLFSTTFVTSPEVLIACLRELREVAGETPVLVGGPFVHVQAKLLRRGAESRRALALAAFSVDESEYVLFQSRRDPVLDGCVFIAAPCGEHTALRVLERIGAGRGGVEDLCDIPNLVLKTGKRGWFHTGRAAEPVDLDAEHTRWDLVDEVPSVVPIRSALGCDGKCRFCGFRIVHPRLRLRTAESVVAEMRLAAARGRVFFNFVDDDVFVPVGRGRALAESIVRAELDVVWGGFIRPDRLEDEDARIVAASGFKFGLAGMESGSPAQLARMGKRMDPVAAVRGIEALTALGARLDLTFIVGFPGETDETLGATAALLNGLARGGEGYAYFELFPFVVFPCTVADTPAFRRRHGLRGRGSEWSHDTMTSREVAERRVPELFSKVTSVPYYHGNDDAPRWWAPPRRDAAFADRAALARGFVAGVGDPEIQALFEALYRGVADPRRAGGVPPWRTVLADRPEQPGRRAR